MLYNTLVVSTLVGYSFSAPIPTPTANVNSTAPAADVVQKSSSRAPFAFTVSGGGFYTMTQGFAFTRALTRAGIEWDKMTHVGGVSGGQWFQTQLVFSEKTFKQLTDTTLPLEDIFAEFGQNYADNAAKLEKFEPHVGKTCGKIVDQMDGLIETVGEKTNSQTVKDGMALVHNLLPLVRDWPAYVGTFMRGAVPGLYTEAGELATYDKVRKASSKPAGLTSASLVQGLVMPAEVYLDNKPLLSLSQLVVEGTDGFEDYLPSERVPGLGSVGEEEQGDDPKSLRAIPLAHVMRSSVSGAGVDGWLETSLTSGKLHVKTSTKLLIAGAGQGMDGFTEYAPVRMPEVDETSVLDVIAGSSAAAGVAAVPSMISEALRKIVHKDVGNSYPMCAPLGLQRQKGELAMPYAGPVTYCYPDLNKGPGEALKCETTKDGEDPMMPEDVKNVIMKDNVDPDVEFEFKARNGAFPFGTIDGGYVDNTALTSTVGTMTADCAKGGLDCESGLSVISVNGGEVDSGLPDLFGIQPHGESNDAQVIDRMPVGEGGVRVRAPNVRIFDLAKTKGFDGQSIQWQDYAPNTYEGYAYKAASRYAYIETETVDNAAYGVKGGYKVSLLVLAVNHDNTQLLGEYKEDPVIVAPDAPYVWKDLYARSARQQDEHATPVLKKFLDGGFALGR